MGMRQRVPLPFAYWVESHVHCRCRDPRRIAVHQHIFEYCRVEQTGDQCLANVCQNGTRTVGHSAMGTLHMISNACRHMFTITAKHTTAELVGKECHVDQATL